MVILLVFLVVLGLGWGSPGSEQCDMTSGVGAGVGGGRKIAGARVLTKDLRILLTLEEG